MEVQQLLTYMDEIIFKQTGKHLDSLQIAIIKGVLEGQKYTEIAEDYHCSRGHAKDEAYALWNILSKELGEDINRSNFKATIERLGLGNFQSPIVGNRFKVNNINLCNNSPENQDNPIVNDSVEHSNQNQTQTSNNINNHLTAIKQAQKQAKLETIPKLINLGLTAQQIAEALELSLDEIQEFM
jgi:DNA-directed RNA polymerase specialized sigma24 family protein